MVDPDDEDDPDKDCDVIDDFDDDCDIMISLPMGRHLVAMLRSP